LSAESKERTACLTFMDATPLHYSVYMRTLGEKVLISVEAKSVKSVSYSHIRSLSGLYTVACLSKGRQAEHLHPATLGNSSVQSTLFSRGPTATLCTSRLVCFKRALNSSCNV